MRIATNRKQRHQEGLVLIAYFVVLLVIVMAIATLGTYVAQTTHMTHRRSDLVGAIHYAQGGAVLTCSDLNALVTNRTGTLAVNAAAKGYTLSSVQPMVLRRTMTTPFTDQSVLSEIRLPSASSFTSAKIVATTTKGKVTQTATVNLRFAWLYPGAIISTSPGSKSDSIDKGTAQDGNVVVNGNKSGPMVVDGGSGMAILANGKANIDKAYANIPPSSISMTNYDTANEIPDYTDQGTANTLFDFDRLTAIANLTTNLLNTATGNNHFTNIATFFAAANAAYLTPAKALEGVIVVDIKGSDANKGNFDPSHLPNGINVKGTLFFKFDNTFGPLDKIVNTATMNINPANLSGLVATNPATYTSGYPPKYHDWTKSPTNINIAAIPGKNFANVAPDEDLPALLYSIGVLDIHGNANISGVCYTPSNMEIENKKDGQIQYFKATLIMGLGIYFENNKNATSIISFDPNAVDSLSTLANAGKEFKVTYWE